MKKICLLICCFSICYCSLFAQKEDHSLLIKNTIIQFFDGMRKVDSSLSSKTLLPDATLTTVVNKPTGELIVKKDEVKKLLGIIGSPHKELYDERVLSYDIRVDMPLATAWCDYSFYIDDKFSHCGTDAFQLVFTEKGWKIMSITDTRHKTCESPKSAEIDTIMNRWHHAAAVADEDTFFGLMTPEADYVGTDPTEHWKRDELKKWSEKYFQRDSAWDFKPKKRYVYFTNDGQYAWFDELLDTWMGDCRGSGVLVKTTEGWRIEQYVLSMAVLNDLTKEYIESLKKYKKK